MADVVTRARAYLAKDKSARLTPDHPTVIIRDLLIELLDRRGARLDLAVEAESAAWDRALGVER